MRILPFPRLPRIAESTVVAEFVALGTKRTPSAICTRRAVTEVAKKLGEGWGKVSEKEKKVQSHPSTYTDLHRHA